MPKTLSITALCLSTFLDSFEWLCHQDLVSDFHSHQFGGGNSEKAFAFHSWALVSLFSYVCPDGNSGGLNCSKHLTTIR